MHGPSLARLLCAGAGFLLGVLWMDLMFDVQALGTGPGRLLPEAALASISAYYRRVTTDAAPMGHLIALVMAVTLVTAIVQAVRLRAPLYLRALSPLLVALPMMLALTRVLPSAVALGARTGSALEQSLLAREILHLHLLCLACMLALMVVQLAVLRPSRAGG